ncbi:hypothetical protein KC711_07025 [Candidatus Peregrinibacteria bacterium]|nr:hypothetical protein [Candidatus Peregrinibacteria bacterium]
MVAQEYLIFSNQCTSVQTCRITDTTNEKWKKFQLYRQEEIKKAEAAQKLIEEDKRLHPEKYKPSSSSSHHSSSSSFG